MPRLLRLAAITSLLLATGVLGAGAAEAAVTQASSNTCSGTLESPGVLAGVYQGDVTVTGVCFVDGGPAVVKGNLVLAPGSALNATFALNDISGHGKSNLTVTGNIAVGSGAVMALGCEPNFQPCSDDPDAENGGTLTSHDYVDHNLVAVHALTVIIHATTIGRDMVFHTGGGGVTCKIPTTGILAALKSPAFFDAEDNVIGGSVTIGYLQTCWMGALRNEVRGNFVNVNNTMADPDANEVLANAIGGSFTCSGNSPQVQYGDSESSPNRANFAFGECAFTVRKPNPDPSGPLTPITVRL